MTMLEIVEPGRKVTVADLLQIEAAIGRPLPDSYRTFLLATNGGQPQPNIIDVEGAPFKGTDINVFHGIDDPSECNDILWNLDVLEGCKENKLLPIATDSCGHLFMIALSEETYGHVLYFDSAEIPPRPYLLAKDFGDFLRLIREPTPEELADIEAAVL